MADQTIKVDECNEPSKSAQVADRLESTTAAVKSLADQALSVGQEMKDKAVDVADSSVEAIKGHASDFAAAAKDVALQTTDKFKETVDGQKQASAKYMGTLADTIRRSAHEFDTDLPIAGVYIRKAAAQVEGVSDLIKSGNLKDLVRSAQSFARRQPTAFLGVAVLAGFGVVRFLKSSAENSTSRSRQSSTADNATSRANTDAGASR